LKEILETDPGIRIIGMVGSGEDALEFLRKGKPDVITMDIVMPGIDGFTATERIMGTTPVPIVIVSSAYKPGEAENSFRAMEAGAVAIIEKPVAPTNPDYPRISRELVQTVKIMSEVKVVTHWGRDRDKKNKEVVPPVIGLARGISRDIDLLVMGSSTGGPPVLQAILSHIPRNIPVPILIVQHISIGFVEGLARWLEGETRFPVHVAKDGEVCLPGHVYLAPDDVQMGVTYGPRIVLEKAPLENGQRPSVSYLFRTAARYFPRNAIGVLLSGMGNDGALELRNMKDMGAVTIAQDEASCVVFGMPGEAVKLGGAGYILPPLGIAEIIVEIIDKKGF